MNKGIFILLILFIIFLGILSYKITNAFFSDTETSTNNLFAAASVFGSPTPTPTSTPSPSTDHLVISEVQIRGANANQDFVELYNPTNSSVDLNGWQIQKKTSSGTISSLVLIGSGKSIPAHGFFLWANDQSGFSTTVGADVSNSNNLSENNSIALEDPSDVIIDRVGWGNGNNQFQEGSIFQSNPDVNANQSLERKALSTSDSTSMAVGGTDEFKGNGFDANDNATDFVLRSVSQPQNSGSATESP